MMANLTKGYPRQVAEGTPLFMVTEVQFKEIKNIIDKLIKK